MRSPRPAGRRPHHACGHAAAHDLRASLPEFECQGLTGSAGERDAIKGGMRKSLLVIAILMLASGAPAEQPGIQRQTTPPAKMLPAKPATSANSCAAYGTGFVKLEGSETCVKVGGAVSVGVGTSRGVR
jgi:hypothetical protein